MKLYLMRRRNGHTLQECADLFHELTGQAWGNWERGDRRVNQDYAQWYAQITDMDYDVIMSMTDEEVDEALRAMEGNDV